LKKGQSARRGHRSNISTLADASPWSWFSKSKALRKDSTVDSAPFEGEGKVAPPSKGGEQGGFDGHG
jgi:hypothetical protein